VKFEPAYSRAPHAITEWSQSKASACGNARIPGDNRNHPEKAAAIDANFLDELSSHKLSLVIAETSELCSLMESLDSTAWFLFLRFDG